jgi:hypothetical protein
MVDEYDAGIEDGLHAGLKAARKIAIRISINAECGDEDYWQGGKSFMNGWAACGLAIQKAIEDEMKGRDDARGDPVHS